MITRIFIVAQRRCRLPVHDCRCWSCSCCRAITKKCHILRKSKFGTNMPTLKNLSILLHLLHMPFLVMRKSSCVVVADLVAALFQFTIVTSESNLPNWRWLISTRHFMLVFCLCVSPKILKHYRIFGFPNALLSHHKLVLFSGLWLAPIGLASSCLKNTDCLN